MLMVHYFISDLPWIRRVVEHIIRTRNTFQSLQNSKIRCTQALIFLPYLLRYSFKLYAVNDYKFNIIINSRPIADVYVTVFLKTEWV